MGLCIKVHSFLLLAIIMSWATSTQGTKIFCYYSSFAQTRQSIGNFMPEDIDPHLCTHIIYAFVDITADGRGLRPFNRNDQGSDGLYARTLALREKNPALKVLLAVGGWRLGSKPFLPMIHDEGNRNAWIKNVVKYLREHGFDGFDVDWEFPATRGSPPEDKHRYTLLMKGLYEAFAQESAETGNEKLILTMATASGTYYINQSYEPREIVKYLDYMLLMTYNYHGQWEKITGHHSGLYRHGNDPKHGEKAQLYQEWSIDFWLNVGIPKSKLIVGIPTYGMTFTLADASDHGVHAPAVGGGQMGEYTRETGIMAYYEVCLNIQRKGWETEWIDDQLVPYAYGGNQWAGFENKRSIRLKAENIAKRGLAGAFVWSVEMDDFDGVCGEGPYPLLSQIVKVLGGGNHYSHEASSQHKPPARQSIAASASSQAGRRKFKKRPSQTKKVRAWGHHAQAQEEEEEEEVATTTLATTTPEEVHETRAPKRLKVRWWTGSTGHKVQKWKPRPNVHKPQQKKKQKINPWGMTRERKWKSKPVTTKPAGTWWTKPAENDVDYSDEDSSEEDHWEPNNHQASAASGSNIDCGELGVGTFADPSSCSHFVICLPGNWRDYAPQRMACPTGTKFDTDLKICNFADNVNC